MDIRNIQRTGKMHYVYLPTQWCKQNNVSSSTKVFLNEQADGSLIISSEQKERKGKHLELTLPLEYKETLINLIMACYVNPVSSFKIKFDEKIDTIQLLKEKNIISGLEFVELDKDHISYESSGSNHDPLALLKMLLRKIKNLLYVLIEKGNNELVMKYEEEIDRTKTQIQRSIISTLTLNQIGKLSSIELYYILKISTELERLVDKLISFDGSDKSFLQKLELIIDRLKEILENLDGKEGKDHIKGLSFTQMAFDLPEYSNATHKQGEKNYVKRHLHNIAEIVLDWIITKKIQD